MGRQSGKKLPEKVKTILEKYNHYELESKSEITIILFIKNMYSVPSNKALKSMLSNYSVFPNFIQPFELKDNTLHVKARLPHPSPMSISLVLAPECGLNFTDKNSRIIFRAEIARSGH